MSAPSPAARPRDPAARKAEILQAARTLFIRDSYENVGMRDIAAAAGVDAALVCRYAGSKAELFADVLACSGDPAILFAGAREDFGARIAGALVDAPEEDDKLDGLLLMLRSASSPGASGLIGESIEARLYAPLARWLGGREAAARARAIGAVLMGASLSRALTGDYGLKGPSRRALRDRLARILQDIVDG